MARSKKHGTQKTGTGKAGSAAPRGKANNSATGTGKRSAEPGHDASNPSPESSVPDNIAAASTSNGTDTMTNDNMTQVRELLFGEQLRHIEQRFSKLESELHATLDQLRERLEQQLQDETAQRDKDVGDLQHQIKQLAQDQENRISAVEDEFRAALNELNGEMQRLLQALEKRQQEDQNQLEHGKVSRAQLADLLQGLAETIRQPPADR